MTFHKRKAFGQHFLNDATVIHTIVDKTLDLARETEITHLIEIGPGKGALTIPLMDLKSKSLPLTLIEKDNAFATDWKKKSDIQVLNLDFLDFSDWNSIENCGVVSNLPYSASTEILARLAVHTDKIRFMVLMFQKEVAQRVIAAPGERNVGRLSMMVQNDWETESLLRVSKRAFTPPPKVESEVVTFRPRKTPKIATSQKEKSDFLDLVKAAFSSRRKTLSNSLNGSQRWKEALIRSGIDGKLRAEALSWTGWQTIFKAETSKD